MHTLIEEKYKIIRTIDSGIVGELYLAEDVKYGNKVLIKVMPLTRNSDYDLYAEADALRKMRHPALPVIKDMEFDRERIYIVEEYIGEVTLERQLYNGKKYLESEVVEWAKQICNLLYCLHKQDSVSVLIPEPKPSNIIVTSDNIVKLVDFGVGCEQNKIKLNDEKSDIYSLGVTMYRLLTGKKSSEPIYDFKPLRMINKSFSHGIEFIVNKCLKNNSSESYKNITQLLHDLNNIHVFDLCYRKEKGKQRVKTLLMSSLMIAFTVMIFVSGSKVLSERTQRYSDIIQKGYQHLELYQLSEAQDCFEEAAQMKSNIPEPYLGTAHIYLKQGSYDECLRYLDQLTEKFPKCGDDAQYNYLMGSVYFEKEEYPDALIYLKKAYNKDKNNDYSRDLAVCYAKLGELDKSTEILESISSDGKTDDVLNYVKGQVSLEKGNIDEAITCFEKTVSLTENEDLKTRAYLELSDIYKAMRHSDYQNWTALDKQIDVLERAVKDLKNEDNLIITEAMAEAYFTSKEYDLSIAKFNRLIELGYERAYIYRNIAIIYQQTGDFDNAEKTLLTMKEKYPENYQCYLQLAYLYMEIESYKDNLVRDYSRVLENYNLAVKYAPSGSNTSDVLQLTAKIDELREKGWL